MIRIAAVGDIHYDQSPCARMREHFATLGERADLLLIAGDLTRSGHVDEARALAVDLSASSVPVIAVLGNHDYHQGHEHEILSVLRGAGVTALEGESALFELRGKRIGIVGLKGFGGGFSGASVTEFGEPEVKSFARRAKEEAATLERELEKLKTDYRFVLLHFSPTEETLIGERREIFPFLGSYLLAEAIDRFGADCVFHGHAHMGRERGATPGGVPVRNVAQPVIRHAYAIYRFKSNRDTFASA